MSSKWFRTLIGAGLALLSLAGCGDRRIQNPTESAAAQTPALTARVESAEIPVEPAVSPVGFEELGQAAALRPDWQDDLAVLDNLTRYRLKLVINPELGAYEGTASLVFTNTEAISLDELYLRLLPNGGKSYGNGFLEVGALKVDQLDQPVELEADQTVMVVELGDPLMPGEQVHVDLGFQGQVPEDFETNGYGIFNLSQGVLALSGWYPILAVYDENGWNLNPVSAIGDSVYSETALYEVEITAPETHVLAATGIPVDRIERDGMVQYEYISGPVRDFFIILGSDFQQITTQVTDIQLNSYFLPGQEAGGRAALEIAAESMRIFNQRFGEYPFTELDVVAAPMRGALGVEFPGIILVSGQLYADPGDPSFVVATAHEVAHQWWYSVVGNDVYDHPWMDEALTTYSSGLYYQDAVAQGAYEGLEAYWQQRYEGLEGSGDDEPVAESLAYFENLPNPGVYGGIVYSKGALFFAALRDEIGDQAFFSALRDYYRLHKYAIAEPEDLLVVFEQASGRSLDDFYREWLGAME